MSLQGIPIFTVTGNPSLQVGTAPMERPILRSGIASVPLFIGLLPPVWRIDRDTNALIGVNCVTVLRAMFWPLLDQAYRNLR